MKKFFCIFSCISHISFYFIPDDFKRKYSRYGCLNILRNLVKNVWRFLITLYKIFEIKNRTSNSSGSFWSFCTDHKKCCICTYFFYSTHFIKIHFSSCQDI